ncbi:protein of unknown function [Candidatus Filomicrobium marinum]|uniref:Uncharacterized protein n=1 Tax=Candidatus Filomicrobium marinum TaxID=1608628 RepID=A0A0D6JLQ0_9HYPH|nr:protein of unknown function [Candidatus Filomicrobium marinum]CPR22585.1 protein of unknown function [Candidatus Filomicrobium marinum]
MLIEVAKQYPCLIRRPTIPEPVYRTVGLQSECPVFRGIVFNLRRIGEIPFRIAFVRISTKEVHERQVGYRRPRSILRLNDWTKHDRISATRFERMLDFCQGSQPNPMFVFDRNEYHHAFDGDFVERKPPKVISKHRPLRVVQSLFFIFDADTHPKEVGERHLNFERMALLRYAIVIIREFTRRHFLILALWQPPRMSILTLKLDGPRLSLKILDLELPNRRPGMHPACTQKA